MLRGLFQPEFSVLFLYVAGRQIEAGAESEAGDGEVLTGHSGGDCAEKQSRQRQCD